MDLIKYVNHLMEKRNNLKKELQARGETCLKSNEYLTLKNLINRLKKGKDLHLVPKSVAVIENSIVDENSKKGGLLNLQQKLLSLKAVLKTNKIACRRSTQYNTLQRAINRLKEKLKN